MKTTLLWLCVRNTVGISLMLLMCFCSALLAHQDCWTTKQIGNVKARILTGFNYEEINKVFLYAELAERLAKKMHYSKPILLEFYHNYTEKNSAKSYSLCYSNGAVRYEWEVMNSNQCLMDDTAIVIRQSAWRFDAEATLKLLEYAIGNTKHIQYTQQEVYTHWIDGHIPTIDSVLIASIVTKPTSTAITELLNTRVNQTDSANIYGILYYLRNGKFTIYRHEDEKPDTAYITLDNIYQFNRFDNDDVMVFDTDTSFYYIKSFALKEFGKHHVSKRHVLADARYNYSPFRVREIGGNKISIYFWYFNPNPPAPVSKGQIRLTIIPERTALYYTERDELKQNIDEILDARK